MPAAPLLIVIVGPTAVGKTAVAIKVAQHLGTDIISADSRQLFREMSIGTAKPTAEEQAAATHHFVDHLSVTDTYSAGQYEREALPLIEQLLQEKGTAVLAGGSGLYINAVLYGIDPLPKVPDTIRAQVNRDFEEKGLPWLQQQVQQHDPQFYARADIQNPSRLKRAYEMYLATGQPLSSLQQNEPKDRPFRSLIIGLQRDRKELYQRINQRVDHMVDEGLVEEARALYPQKQHTALQTVGYQELFQHFDGSVSLSEAIELIKRNSRRYAKRQMTWFRRYNAIHWFQPEEVEAMIKLIEANLKH